MYSQLIPSKVSPFVHDPKRTSVGGPPLHFVKVVDLLEDTRSGQLGGGGPLVVRLKIVMSSQSGQEITVFFCIAYTTTKTI